MTPKCPECGSEKLSLNTQGAVWLQCDECLSSWEPSRRALIVACLDSWKEPKDGEL